MNEQFNELISQLQSMGYDADNEDLMDLDINDGSGFVSFYGLNRISVALKFEDFKLDLNGQGHMLKFYRRFTIDAPSQAVIKGAEREFHIELDLIALPNRFFEVMTRAIEVTSKIKVQ